MSSPVKRSRYQDGSHDHRFEVPGRKDQFPHRGTMIEAIAARDYPVVLGLTLVYAATVIVANLLADLLLWWLDPRRRSA